MSFEIVVSELEQIYGYTSGQEDADNTKRNHLTAEDIERWTIVLGVTPMGICERIAEHIARGFHSREIGFPYCDAIANALWGYMIRQFVTNKTEWSPFCMAVYQAFDQGEFRHGERLDEDPVEVHTRPLIAGIVAGLDSDPT